MATDPIANPIVVMHQLGVSSFQKTSETLVNQSTQLHSNYTFVLFLKFVYILVLFEF